MKMHVRPDNRPSPTREKHRKDVLLLVLQLAFAGLSLGNARANDSEFLVLGFTASAVVKVDTATGSLTKVADMPFSFAAVDYNPVDRMIYGVNGEFNRINKFYRINPSTGGAQLVAELTVPAGGDGTIDSIGFRADGSLLAYDEHFDMIRGQLLQIDLSALTVTALGSSGTPSCLGGDFDQVRSTYWVSDEWMGKLYQLNPSNGSIVWTSTSTWYTGVGIGDLWNLDIAPDGQAYVVASESGATKLLRCDPNSGTWVTQCELPTVSDAWGFKIVSVPLAALDRMVFVKGGTLPSSSLLGEKVVGDFFAGRFEVTWKEWREVRDYAVANGYDLAGVGRGTASPDFAGPDLDANPVHSVNWFQALKWCNAKSEKEGLSPVYKFGDSVYRTGESVPTVDVLADGYRLPTEAEWEWAALGGINSTGSLYAGSDDLDKVGWYWNNSSNGTKPVGLKKSNELALFDMSGNVIEWCQDVLGETRAYRGGGWGNDAPLCTPYARFTLAAPTLSFWDLGLRVVRNAPSRDTDGDGLSDAWERGDGRYEVVQGKLTWLQARDDAESKGGHLVTVTTQDEWTYLKKLISGYPSESFWLGGTDEEQEGVWKWITGEIWSFTSWISGQPDNSGGEPHIAVAVDGDGIVNDWNDFGAPWRGHLLSYVLEFGYPTDANDPDSDDDGYNDKVETDAKTDPNNPASKPVPPDADGDGIPDAYETNTGVYVSPTDTGTDPNKSDTDGDGLSDGVETATYIYIDASDTGTDPNKADTDEDGLSDAVETNTGIFVDAANTGSNPLNDDTSNDGLLDGEVAAAGFNPNTNYTPLFNLVKAKGAGDQARMGLFTESAMMDMNLGGVTLRKTGSTVNLRLQIQSKINLNDPNWHNEGTETFILDMPGNKAFMRIRALGPQ